MWICCVKAVFPVSCASAVSRATVELYILGQQALRSAPSSSTPSLYLNIMPRWTKQHLLTTNVAIHWEAGTRDNSGCTFPESTALPSCWPGQSSSSVCRDRSRGETKQDGPHCAAWRHRPQRAQQKRIPQGNQEQVSGVGMPKM